VSREELIAACEHVSSVALLAALGSAIPLDHRIIPMGASARFAGSAVTCRCPAGDNLTVLRALERCRTGDVLLVATDPAVPTALFGGLTAAWAAAIGLTGVVVDGYVRDVWEIRQLELPTWARGVRLAGPEKRSLGEIGGTIELGGASVSAGDLVRADDDGIVVVPAAGAEATVARAAAIERREEQLLARVRAGARLSDLVVDDSLPEE
jgi:regulator of RNase E activity RraA